MQETVIQVLSLLILLVATVLVVMSWQALRRSVRSRHHGDLPWPGAAPGQTVAADRHATALGKR